MAATVKAAGISSLAPGTAVQTAPLQVGGVGEAGGWGSAPEHAWLVTCAWPFRPW